MNWSSRGAGRAVGITCVPPKFNAGEQTVVAGGAEEEFRNEVMEVCIAVTSGAWLLRSPK